MDSQSSCPEKPTLRPLSKKKTKKYGRSSKRKKKKISKEDASFRSFYKWNDVAVLYVIELLRDGKDKFHFGSAGSSRDESTVLHRFAHEGLGFLSKTLPELFQCLLRYLETGESSYPSSFKLKKNREYPAFLQQYFSVMYGPSEQTDKAKVLDHLYQVCTAFKKLKGPYRKNVLRAQLAQFVETDIELRYLDFHSRYARTIIDAAAQDLKILLSDLELQDRILPRPGPGATNTRLEKHERFRPHVLYDALHDEFPYEEWFYSHPWDLVTGVHKHPFKLPRVEYPTSRFKFVAKTFAKPRGICIEENETQYLQQGLRGILYDYLEQHPVTKGRVMFRDQSVNSRLALSSSLTKDMSTIDMSEASDRISRDLVFRCFKHLPFLRDRLMALSTREIELPDDIDIGFIDTLPCAKYAPMGSALCFPVMGLIHFVLIRSLLDYHGYPEHRDSVYVYGDDIIIPSEVTELIMDELPSFGMKLNVEKSYYRSYFRESCGCHAYYGHDITPVYFKYTPINTSVEGFYSLLQNEAALFKKGCYRTAKLLREHLRQQGLIKYLPYVAEHSPIPGFMRESEILDGPKLLGYRSRKKDASASTEYRVQVLVPKREKHGLIPQDEAYLRWMLTGATLEIGHIDLCHPGWILTPKQLHVEGGAERLTIAWRWIGEPGLRCNTLDLH